MLQKLQKKLKAFIEEKGQGVVEYALVLGFVAVIAVYLIGNSDIKGQVVDKGINNAKSAATVMQTEFNTASAKDTGTP
ncbi:MAG: pilin protein [Selenomonadaceae bacterium]|nr:pilin protein [Selenomonadaceae bacterium]